MGPALQTMTNIRVNSNRFYVSMRLTICIALALLVGVQILSAQSQQKQPSTNHSRADSPSEGTLAREVRHQLQVLPYYSVFDNITFVLDPGGKVMLSGQVLRPTMKVNAAESVRSLEGVTSVVNQIEVLPESQSDDQLRRDVYRAIFEDQVLQKYAIQSLPSIRIIVKNGNVALEGFADSPSDKNLAASKAASVSNVSGVKNNLVVRSVENNK